MKIIKIDEQKLRQIETLLLKMVAEAGERFCLECDVSVDRKRVKSTIRLYDISK